MGENVVYMCVEIQFWIKLYSKAFDCVHAGFKRATYFSSLIEKIHSSSEGNNFGFSDV